MKKLAELAAVPLKRTSIEHGEKFAWWLFLVMAGFGFGWASAIAHWGAWCFQAV